MEKHIKESFNDKHLKRGSELFGFDESTLEEIGGFENFIYSFIKDDKKYVIRFVHSDHRTLHELNSEIEFIHYLHENGAKVIVPELSVNGNFVEKIDEAFFANIFEYAPGRAPGPDDRSPAFFREYGRVMAKMHKLTIDFEPKYKRYSWYEEKIYADAESYLPKNKKHIYNIFMEQYNELKKLDTPKDSYGLIHTDMHRGNFFVDDDLNFIVFDFDDCAYKWFIHDIAMVLFYAIWFTPTDEERIDYIMTHFMEGYNEVYKLDDKWFEVFDKFLKLRQMDLYIVIYRSFDHDNLPEWALKFIELHEHNIEAREPFTHIDYTKYNKTN